MNIEISPRELANILTGLRKLQREGYDEHDVFIATDDGRHKLMPLDKIDSLCERINHT